MILTFFQLYRRVSQVKSQSENLAFRATDGNIAINRPSTLDAAIMPDDLSSQNIQSWVGPVFSNQNTHVVWLAVDSTPNTENTLIATENFLIGLLFGPAENSDNFTTQALNILPISNAQKNAFGAVFDSSVIKQNIENEFVSMTIPELVQKHSGFVVPYTEILEARMVNSSIKISFKNQKTRSWTYAQQDGQLKSFFEQLQHRLHLTP